MARKYTKKSSEKAVEQDEDMTYETLRFVKGLKKAEKNDTATQYNLNVRKAVQNVLQSEYTRNDGEKVSVADMLVASTVLKGIKTGSAQHLQTIAKVSGDLSENMNVNVTGYESLLKKIEDKEEF